MSHGGASTGRHSPLPCRLDGDVKTFLGLDDKSVVRVELLPIIGV